MWTYHLDGKELASAETVARARNQNKVAHGIGRLRTYNGRDESTFDLHLHDAKAEIALAAMTDGIVNMTVDVKGNKTEGNVRLSDGRTAMVKWRDRDYDFALKTADMRSFHGDVGVLAWPGVGAAITLVGWLSREECALWGLSVNWGYGPRLSVPWRRLHPMDTLFDIEPKTKSQRRASTEGLMPETPVEPVQLSFFD